MTASRITASRRISIHALRVEGDVRRVYWIPVCPRNFYPRPPGGGRRQIAIPGAFNIINFYPRPPGGGRQGDPNYYEYSPEISIHALRVEGDVRRVYWIPVCPRNFYPRPPGGGRRQIAIPGAFNIINFYPRPPGGGRQGDPNYYEYSPEISIHALRVEGDNLH